MRLYGAIQKIEPQDDGTVRVHGIATSEALDDQGEIVRAEAMRAAIPDYMRFPALREMHQLSAAGTTLEAEVCEDGTTRIVAHVVDPVAVAKVKNQVYRGFSIGGQVTQREPGNPKAIVGLVLNEISLVDRPANPEAIYDCWKAAKELGNPPVGVERTRAASGPASSSMTVIAALESAPFNSPIQIWACGVLDHRHLAKADAIKCLKKQAAEPGNTQTNLGTPAECGDGQRYTDEQEMGGRPDGSNNIGHLSLALQTREILTTAGGGSRIAQATAFHRKGSPEMEKPAGDRQADANYSPRDQMLVDIAQLACNECSKLGGLSADKEEHMVGARDRLSEAGAALLDDAAGANVEMLGVVAALLNKGRTASQAMMDVAHECISQLSDGTVCEAKKAGQRYSRATMEQLKQAHGHLVAAGAQCEAEDHPPVLLEGQRRDSALEPERAESTGKIAPMLAGEHVEKARVVQMLAEILPALERLTKRVDDMARTPLPPLTIAKGTVSVSKQQDRGSISGDDPEMSTEALASAFAKLSKEDQTLTLIKASYANPIRVPGSAAGER